MATFYYGGQAVLEGVMMRGRYHFAVAVRKQTDGILVHSEPLKGTLYESPLAKIPFVRGVFMLGETLSLGMKSLMWSAEVAASDQTGEPVEFGKGAMWGMVGSALLFGVALFFVVPLLLAGLMHQVLPSSLASNLAEGGVRLALVLGYMWAIGRLPDVRRVFGFHGAEHKTVNAHEAGAPLDVRSVQRFSTQHVRCGTSFLLTLVVISVFVFALIGEPGIVLKVLSRIVLVPVIAAIAYEVLRFAAGHVNNPIVRVLYRPNLSLQSFTTREPDDAQVEVAIVALQRVLEADAETARERASTTVDQAVPTPPVAVPQAG